MNSFERMPQFNIEPEGLGNEKNPEKTKEIKKEAAGEETSEATKKERKLDKKQGITRREFLKWGAGVAGGILAEKLRPIEALAKIGKNIEAEPCKELIKKFNNINGLMKKIEKKEDLPEEIKRKKIIELLWREEKIFFNYPGFESLLGTQQPKESQIENYKDFISSSSYSDWHPLTRRFLSRLTVDIVEGDKTGKSSSLLGHFLEKDELSEFSEKFQNLIFSGLLDILKQKKQKEKIEIVQEVLNKWFLSEKINDLKEASVKLVTREIFKMRFDECLNKKEGYASKFIDYYFKHPENLNKLSPTLSSELLDWARGAIYEVPSVKKFWKDFFIQERNKEEKYGPLILQQLGNSLEFLGEWGVNFTKGFEEAGYHAFNWDLLYKKLPQKGFPSLYKKILKDVDFYKENNSLESVYGGVGRITNAIHDYYERENWQEKVSHFLGHLSDKKLGYLLSYGGFELYTGTYNEVYKHLLDTIEPEGENFLEWIKKKYPENVKDVRGHFLLSLASRRKIGEIVKQQNIDLKNLIGRVCQSVEESGDKKLSLSYLMVALEEIYSFSDEKEKKYLLEQIEKIKESNSNISVFKMLTRYRFYPESLSKENLTPKEKKILNLIECLEKPDYQELIKEKNTLKSLVVFSQSAEGYLEELKKLFKEKKYKDRGYSVKEITINKSPGYLIKGKVKDQKGRIVNVEFYLSREIEKEKFRELMESGKYSLIFTRHHSYEGKKFLGAGSDKVLPQICGTIGTGKGAENNAMVIVAAEEIAKGSLENFNWNKVWQNMSKRMSLENFRPPNNLSFLFSYASRIEMGKINKKRVSVKKPQVVVVFDGGCGGVNRVPQYLSEYKKSINNFVSRQ